MTDRRAKSSSIGPVGRPFAGWRVLFAVLALIAGAGNVVLLLSDRAPGILSQLSKRLEQGDERVARATSHADLARSEFVVHVAVWACATIVVGFAMWSWRSLVGGSGAVVVASALLEVAQPLFTSSRSAQLEDFAANLLGVTVGFGLTAAIWVLIESRRRAITRAGVLAVDDRTLGECS